MEENRRAPFLSPTSNTNNWGYMISLSNENNCELVPPPPPPPPSFDVGHEIKEKENLTNTSISKRPIGRPLSSKNNSKPPIPIKQDTDQLFKQIIIEIPAGHDVIDVLTGYAHRHRAGISVLSVVGYVSDVTLYHPLCRLQGHFNMVSLTGTYMSDHFPPSTSIPPLSNFSIQLSDYPGRLFGGVVGGKVVAACLVMVKVLMFKKIEHHNAFLINGSVEVKDSELSVDAGEPSNSTDTNTTISMPNNMSAFGVGTNSI